MTPNLYPHQQRIIDALPTRKILAWATSLGKTRALIELAKKAHSTPLIICPKSIKSRWMRDFPTATVVTKEEFRRDWSKLPWFDAVIVDECFVAGTKVLTPYGYKNIESIRNGDKIISAFGEDIVDGISNRVTDEIIIITLSNKKIIKVTKNHRFFTTQGWIKANNIQLNDVLLHYLSVHDMIYRYEMQKLQQCSPYWKQGKGESFLLSELYNEISVENKKKNNGNQYNNSVTRSNSPSQFITKNEKEKSYVDEGSEREDYGNKKENWFSSVFKWIKWRKWEGDATSTEGTTFSIRKWLGRRICRHYEDETFKNWLSDLLQNRHRSSKTKNCNRNRRRVTQFFNGERKRQKERIIFGNVWVESIKIQKQRNTRVYNISVKNHPSYIVEDILVHNCHAFSGFSLMSKALQAYLKKRRPSFVWGASATPWRSTPWNVYNLAKIMGAEWGYTKFRDSFFRTQYFGARCVWVPKEDDATRTRLVNALSKFCDIVSAEEAGMPPEDVFEEELFTLTAEQKKAIKDIALTESNPVVRYGKEHQIAQGHLKGTEFEASRTYKNEKTDRILELAQEHPSMLIFARYTGQIELIAEALKKKGHTVFTMTGATKDRDKLIQDVENAKECILIVQTALGEGFEVPRFDFAIFASLPWSYVEYMQCVGRASRVNVPKRRTYVTFTVEGSIDEAVRDALHNKRDFIIELYDK